MKIGVRAHDFGRQPAQSLAANIKKAGFDCVQLAPAKAIEGINSFDDITESSLEVMHTAFLHNNVEITVLGCYIEPSVPDKEPRLKNVDIFKANLTNAKKLGVKIVGTETTGMDIFTPQAEREKIFVLLKDSVMRMVEQAEKEDVFIGIEPVAEHTLNTPDLTRRLLDEVKSDKLKIIFDPVNLVLPGTIHRQDEIFHELFTILGEDIVAVHIKDIVIEDGQKTWRNIGEGVINYRLIFDWLLKHKPDIRILREDAHMDSYEKDIKAMYALSKT
ncbi:MAG: sugar phosphate isomerase/epimerase [Firmicutes bacterium]|nr:sugar phosphate isomerase/epimerase [Bacillota bacterium]